MTCIQKLRLPNWKVTFVVHMKRILVERLSALQPFSMSLTCKSTERLLHNSDVGVPEPKRWGDTGVPPK